MSLLRRKLTFQLTPLLDLLLIVIFAQYLDVQHVTERREADLRQETHVQLTALRSQRERAVRRVSTADEQVAQLKQENARLMQLLQKRETELGESLRRAVEQQRLAGDLVAELFQVPTELVEESFRASGSTDAARPEEEVERLRRSFQELARKRGREVIQHLLTYEELRKRCDIWDIYIEEQGTVVFRAGDHTHTFRADTAGSFEKELFERYKSLPQPKSLVVILLSYGDAKAGPRQAALDGLPKSIDRMRADSNGRSRFEYANLGFNPHPPMTDAL